MSSHRATTRRKLLVIGATGKQGRALIQALVSSSPPSSNRTPAAASTAASDAVVTTAAADKDSNKAIVITTTSEAAAIDGRGAAKTPPSSQQQLQQDQEEEDPVTISWDILAVTRNPSSPRAKSLLQLLPSSVSADSSDGAQTQTQRHTINLVQGDLDNPASIRAIFEQHNSLPTASDSTTTATTGTSTKIWGVFLVLMYPGVQKKPAEEEEQKSQSQRQGGRERAKSSLKHHIEIRQGRLMTDLAHEFGVEAFVYSSSLPAPLDQMGEEERNPADGDKLVNEGYMKSLGGTTFHEEGGKGLNWIIIRPGFFMENLDGFLGSITVTVFREGLSEDATLPLVATRDIGQVVAGIFKDHTRFLHKTVAITSETTSMREVMAAHQRATGKPISAIPSAVGRLLIKMNAGTRRVLKLYQLSYEARKRGTYYPEFEAECALARTICQLRGYEEWKRSEMEEARHGGGGCGGAAARASSSSISEREGRPGTAGTVSGSGSGTGSGIGFEAGWNQVSIWKLVTGRS